MLQSVKTMGKSHGIKFFLNHNQVLFSLPSAPCWPATYLHLNICVRKVVLWGQFPIIVDEVVKNGGAEYGLALGQ